jgi:hypothetical protein
MLLACLFPAVAGSYHGPILLFDSLTANRFQRSVQRTLFRDRFRNLIAPAIAQPMRLRATSGKNGRKACTVARFATLFPPAPMIFLGQTSHFRAQQPASAACKPRQIHLFASILWSASEK